MSMRYQLAAASEQGGGKLTGGGKPNKAVFGGNTCALVIEDHTMLNTHTHKHTRNALIAFHE